MGPTTNHQGDSVSFEWEGILGDTPSFLKWDNPEPCRISRIAPTPCELTVAGGSMVRVILKNESEETVSGSFGASTDDALICRKPVKFEGDIKAEVSGPKGQKVKFALTGKLIPKDEL